MKSVTINLNSIDKVKAFVNVISVFEGEFDLSCGRYLVDAKSIMGILSLDLGKEIILGIHNDSIAMEVIEKLETFIVR